MLCIASALKRIGVRWAPQNAEPLPLAPELMIQAGSYRIYVNGSIQETTLETVLRVIRDA